MFNILRRQSRPSVVVLSTLLAGPSAIAFAQEPPKPVGEEIIVTAPALLTAPAQTVTSVDREQFKDSQAFSVGQVLQYSPGVTVKQGNGPRDVGISIRGSNDRNGFGIRNMQMLEDGFPITQPDGLSRSDLADPHAYAGMDVYQGPSSARFGNYATGGAINFRTRTGAEIDGVELGSDAGSFGYFNEYLSAGGHGEEYDYALFGSHVRGNGFIANGDFRTTTEDITASYSPTVDDKFTFKIINNDLDTHLPIRLSLNQYYQNPFQRGCATAATAGLGCATVKVLAADGTPTQQTAQQAGLGRNDRRTIAGVRWEHAIDDQTVLRTVAVFDNKDINQPTGSTSALGDSPAVNLQSDLTRTGSLFGLAATHSAGLFFSYVDLESLTYNVMVGGDARLGGLASAYSGHQYNLGGRAREEIELASGWAAVLGADVEYTDLAAVNHIYSTSPATVIPVARGFVDWAYEAALRYRPDADWDLHLRAASAYGTPQAGNLFVTPAGDFGNNTQLKPQTNDGIDLGADWSPSDSFRASVTGFYEFFTNELVTQSPGAGLQNYTFNAPASEHRGIEVSAMWKPLPGWQLRGSYTYDDQIYTDYGEQLSAGALTKIFNRNGNAIPGVQPNFLTARVGYDQPTGPFAGLGAFVEYSWRGGFFMDNANLLQAPGYRLVNLNFHYHPDVTFGAIESMTLFLEIQNLFDTGYVASANNVADSINSTTGDPNPASVLSGATGSIYAGAPRTFVGGVRIKL
ncbi:MAG TPA: TonB-dependent receptor [Alphaproteobacteria bacterium]|nr:TonB-dependent receptor [Alphaproteobacteria bacterium]